jgi:hypothetical protein
MQTVGAAWNFNWMNRNWRFMQNRSDHTADPSHDPFALIRGTKYASDPERFAYSRNEQETRAIMQEWDDDENATAVIRKSGWKGIVAMVAMGSLDPTIFLPVAKVFTGAKAGITALRLAGDTAIAGAESSAISEAMLAQTTPHYTFKDAAINVGTSTLLSGLLGAGAGALLSHSERLAATAKLDEDRLAMTADMQPAGAAATDTRNVQLVKTPIDKALDAIRSIMPESVKAHVPVTDWLAKLSPTRRVLNSPFQAARRALVDLAETPYLFEGQIEGRTVTNGPALDRLVKLYVRQGRVGLSDTMESAFTRYRGGHEDLSTFESAVQKASRTIADLRGRTDGKLTYSQFKDAIDEALRNGDQHVIPEVAEVAQWTRQNIIVPWRDRAIKAGLLPEGVDVETAASYMTRAWNTGKIVARRPEVVERFTNWLESEQSRKAGIQEKLAGLARQLDEAEGTIRTLEQKAKGGSDVHIAAIGRAAQLREQIEAQLREWKGNSVDEALAAMNRRDASMAGRDPNAPRLAAADSAVATAVKRILGSDRTLGRPELLARANEMVDRIIGSPDGRLPYDTSTPHNGGPPVKDARGPLASRDFMIPDAMVRDLLHTDVEHVLSRFLNSIIPDVLMTEKFGDVQMSEIFRRINEESAARVATAKTERARAAIEAQRQSVEADIAAIRDRVRGTYGNTTDPRMRFWGRMAANAGRYNQLTDMGGVTLTSVPDIAGPIFQYGIPAAFKHQLAPLMRLFGSKETRDLAKASKQELRAFGIGVETVMQARQSAIADIFDMYQPTSRLERGLEKASNAFFILNGLSPWTDAMQRIAGTVSMDQMSRAIEATTKGKPTALQVRKLAESGIDSVMAGRIWNELTREGGSNVVDGVRVSNTGAWRDIGARDAFEGALARDVDMMVISPGQEKSLWPSRNPVVALLLQYKTFVMGATERIFFRSMQARDAQVLQGLVAFIGLGMLGEYAYDIFSGHEMPSAPGDWVKAGASRSGVFGWIEEGNAIGSKWTGGTMDMYRLVGAKQPGSRYQSREKLGILLGPTANKLEGLIKAGSNGLNGSWDGADYRRMRRMIAGQNLFYLRKLFDQLGDE